MKNAATHAKKFTTLCKKLKASYPIEAPDALDPVAQIIVGFLEWEATHKQAVTTHARLMEQVVDNNDLRVTHHNVLVASLSSRYPRAEERIARLKDALEGIFKREHATSLDNLATKHKKNVRTYLDSLPGMVPYVAAQVALLCFDVHAIPVDDRLLTLLKQEQVVEPETTIEEAEAFLQRQIKAGQGVEAHSLFRAWADSPAATRGTTRKTKSPAKKTTKKKVAKKK